MTPSERRFWVNKMGDRAAWWQLREEPVMHPEWEIIDSHFHLWEARDLPDPQGGGGIVQMRGPVGPERAMTL